MAKAKHKDPFWTSYSDLMTSLFFVMLVLFIICLIKVGHDKEVIETQYRETKASNEQLKQILQLEEQFKVLGQSTSLGYDKDKKMFYAKDFVGIEIFYSNQDKIKEKYLETVDKVGNDLMKILKALSNDNFHYQLVIEGNAAIKWDQLKHNTFDPDNTEMYHLSYRRALALYNRWRAKGHDFRKYNTEIIIAGSGFNGNNRDQKVEENNKRFIIQIIPKINRPEIKDSIK